MKKIFLLLIAGLFIAVTGSGCSAIDNSSVESKTEAISSAVIKSDGQLPATKDALDSKKCLVGLFGGWSRMDKTMWVSLAEDIEGVEEGHGVTIKLTDELEKQILDYEIGDKLYVYYDDISITDEPLIETPYKIALEK